MFFILHCPLFFLRFFFLHCTLFSLFSAVTFLYICPFSTITNGLCSLFWKYIFMSTIYTSHLVKYLLFISLLSFSLSTFLFLFLPQIPLFLFLALSRGKFFLFFSLLSHSIRLSVKYIKHKGKKINMKAKNRKKKKKLWTSIPTWWIGFNVFSCALPPSSHFSSLVFYIIEANQAQSQLEIQLINCLYIYIYIYVGFRECINSGRMLL